MRSKSHTLLPKKIHFIWIGGILPQDYLDTILFMSFVAQRSGFELNVWLDDERHYQNALEKKCHALSVDGVRPQAFDIQLRNLAAFAISLRQNPFFNGTDPLFPLHSKEKNRLNYFLSCINREEVGFKNLAAASDFWRYAILLQEGGYYFDTDTRISGLDTTLLEPNCFPEGFAFHFQVQNHVHPMAEGSLKVGNDILAFLPDHPIIKQALMEAMNEYKVLDLPPLHLFHQQNNMDRKRFPYDLLNAKEKSYRVTRTLSSSGSGVLIRALHSYTERSLESLVAHNGIGSTFLNPLNKKDGIKIESCSDWTWMNHKPKRQGFDDATLPKRSLDLKYGDGGTRFASYKHHRINVIHRINNIRPCFFSAAKEGDGGYLYHCLENGFDVNSIEHDTGCSALHLALKHQQLNTVGRLLSKTSIDIHAQNNEGDTPLHLAVTDCDSSMVRLLLEKGAITDINCPNEDDWTPLHHMVRQGDALLLEEVLSHPEARNNINQTTNEGCTVLHLAIYFWRSSSILDLLLKVNELDVNAQDNEGNTPLDLAIAMNNCDAISILSSHTDLNAGCVGHGMRFSY